jgi:hypothetical protein
MAVKELREALLASIRGDGGVPDIPDNGRPPAYMARRIAWHTLDHAWEMQDR